jgi:hypothetical protein
VGPDDFTISQRSQRYGMTFAGFALDPVVAADPQTGRYLVAYYFQDETSDLPTYVRPVVTATG